MYGQFYFNYENRLVLFEFIRHPWLTCFITCGGGAVNATITGDVELKSKPCNANPVSNLLQFVMMTHELIIAMFFYNNKRC